jgi:DNA replication and repair protein RecF
MLHGHKKHEALIFKGIRLWEFKNYRRAVYSFTDRVVCITGPNGVGKTNLLDALSYCCWTKSYFQSTDKQCVKDGRDFFRIEALIANADSESHRLVLRYKTGEGKQVYWDEKAYERLSDHLGKIPLVVVSPDDIVEFLSGSKARRRFMDFTISQYDGQYLKALNDYRRLLRQRNAYLKTTDDSRLLDRTLLKTLGEQMAPSAFYIFEKRSSFMESFGKAVQDRHQLISGSQEMVSCSYRSPLAATDFSQLIDDNLEKDIVLRRTSTGVHKDDIKVYVNGAPLKIRASQGQQKSFILSLKTAQFQWLYEKIHRRPILLLDDFFEKLDSNRLSSLMKMVVDMDFGQIFLTDTDEKRVANLFDSNDITYQLISMKEDLSHRKEEE